MNKNDPLARALFGASASLPANREGTVNFVTLCSCARNVTAMKSSCEKLNIFLICLEPPERGARDKQKRLGRTFVTNSPRVAAILAPVEN